MHLETVLLERNQSAQIGALLLLHCSPAVPALHSHTPTPVPCTATGLLCLSHRLSPLRVSCQHINPVCTCF